MTLRLDAWRVRNHNDVKQMEVLMNCVLFSGLIKNAASTNHALQLAIKAALPPHLHEAFLHSLSKEDAVPSKASLYRHRATLCLGYARMRAEENARMLRSGGMLRWSLIDSSPQGNVDWLLATSSTVAAELQDSALSDVQVLWESALNHSSDMDTELSPEVEAATDRLSRLLQFQPSFPVGIGSGRAGSQYKLRAFIHAVFLESCGWPACAQLLSCICSITSDLGTESYLAGFQNFELPVLFPWIPHLGEQTAGASELLDFSADASAALDLRLSHDSNLQAQPEQRSNGLDLMRGAGLMPSTPCAWTYSRTTKCAAGRNLEVGHCVCLFDVTEVTHPHPVCMWGLCLVLRF